MRQKENGDMIPLGKRIDAEPEDEAEHFTQCRACGQAFDMRDLEALIHHETPSHTPLQRN